MRILVAISTVAVVCAVVATILYFTGTTKVAPLALVLGFIAFTSGVTALTWHLGAWGVPGDRDG